MIEFIVTIIIDVFLYGTAKILLPLISFGKWRADIKKSQANLLSGLPFFKKGEDGILYFGPEGACLFAVLFWIIVIIVIHTISG